MPKSATFASPDFVIRTFCGFMSRWTTPFSWASPKCLLRGLTVQRGPSESPAKGTSDGPSAAYPHSRVPGRGDHGPVLPGGRRLRAPQPEMAKPRVAQEALGLGGSDAGALAAASGIGERTLLPARHPAFLCPPLSGRREDAPLLVASAREAAPAILGALAPLGPARVGRRPPRSSSSTRRSWKYCARARLRSRRAGERSRLALLG